MLRRFRIAFEYSLLICLAIALAFILLTKKGPCEVPITYSIGSFDTSFGISESDFLAAVQQAEAIWEKPIGKKLFAYQAKGDLAVNLLYDQRQATTERNQALQDDVDQNTALADAMKQGFTSLQQEYDSKKKTYEAAEAQFEADLAAYNKDVTYWNGRGGAPRDEYQTLAEQKSALAVRSGELQQQAAELNKLGSQINSSISTYNKVASHINTDVHTINSGAREFNEGEYISDKTGQRINIYEFKDKAQLVRVLAHELGHALGLDHNDNPDSIMYYLNQSTNQKLSPEDLQSLKKVCGIKST